MWCVQHLIVHVMCSAPCSVCVDTQHHVVHVMCSAPCSACVDNQHHIVHVMCSQIVCRHICHVRWHILKNINFTWKLLFCIVQTHKTVSWTSMCEKFYMSECVILSSCQYVISIFVVFRVLDLDMYISNISAISILYVNIIYTNAFCIIRKLFSDKA